MNRVVSRPWKDVALRALVDTLLFAVAVALVLGLLQLGWNTITAETDGSSVPDPSFDQAASGLLHLPDAGRAP